MGLEEAKEKSKPVAAVFCERGYGGPATCDTDALRKAMRESGAVPVKVETPEVPGTEPGATAEEVKALREAYSRAVEEFRKVCADYGVSALPTLVMLTPEGEAFHRLPVPQASRMVRILNDLDVLLERYLAAKALEEARRAAREEKGK